jgi:hypothetical protein
MKRLSFHTGSIPLILILWLALSSACAPAPGMAATLTMLPGTFTPRPNTPVPTITSHPTNTVAPIPRELPFRQRTMEANATPSALEFLPQLTPGRCGFKVAETALPQTMEGFTGQRYNLDQLPEGMTLVDGGMLSDRKTAWLHLTLQGRHLFWLMNDLCASDQKQTQGLVKDSLALPELDAQTSLAIFPTCTLDGEAMNNIIGYGSLQPNSAADGTVLADSAVWDIQAAWEVGLKFTAIDPQRLDCSLSAQTPTPAASPTK